MTEWNPIETRSASDMARLKATADFPGLASPFIETVATAYELLAEVQARYAAHLSPPPAGADAVTMEDFDLSLALSAKMSGLRQSYMLECEPLHRAIAEATAHYMPPVWAAAPPSPSGDR